MSRIGELFKHKKRRVLNVYCTAGYPHLDSTIEVMKSLQENGADLIELGMPYSDPLADGPVIQASSAVALANGMTISRLFTQLKDFRKEVQVPVVLMGYLNPVLQYGFERFCADAVAVGIDGLIIPDIPVYEFETEYQAIVKRYGLDFIFLVTPETPEARMKQIDALSSGFLYAVSSSSITGSDKDFGSVEEYLQRLKNMKLTNPILVGFGIKDKATFEAASKYTAGAIIGSAYIKALQKSGDVQKETKEFLEAVIR
jgi:tryptophan synthase alpha chain